MTRRLLSVLALAAAAAALAPAGAEAARECDGLPACIPVRGPWVQVPGGVTATTYQLSCPGRGQVIGGLDADRAGPLELSFLGTLGGPVSPGITTGRSAVFVARTTRALSAFRPLLGCIPAAGGGGRSRTSYEPKRRLAAVVPVEATIRRVKNVRVRGVQTQQAAHTCLAGERLLGSSVAVAFRQRRPPSLAALGSVRATSRRSGRRVLVTVRSGIARPVDVRVEVQVHAICARGPS